jgi:hypothetical protein
MFEDKAANWNCTLLLSIEIVVGEGFNIHGSTVEGTWLGFGAEGWLGAVVGCLA